MIIALLIWINIFGKTANVIVWAFLIVWSLSGTYRAVQALILGYLIFSMNRELFFLLPQIWSLRWLLLFSSTFRILFDWIRYKRPITWWLPWFAVFILILYLLSFMKSYQLSVSFLKITAFAIGFFAVVMGVNLSSDYSWKNWLLTFWVVVFISGLPLIVSSIGYLPGRGFRGILNHPQEYGVFFAIPSAVFITNIGKNKTLKAKFFYIIMLISILISIIVSRSRTGIFATILAVSTIYIIALIRKLKIGKEIYVKPLSIIAVLAVLLIFTFFFDTIYDSAFSLITKGYTDSIYRGEMDISQAIISTRTQFIIPSWQNFLKNPLGGIGFGLASDPERFHVGKFYGIPITARIEKGFIFSALLEETGIVGTLFFLLFIFFFIKVILRYGNIQEQALLASSIFVNFGEMGFFSPGSRGPYIWLCIAVAVLMAKKREYQCGL
ncbi:hypothetical protein GF312_16560 [Candidatus Poribacteria bacterium]|nr:hypothetical protein [Candidatus Poribacteria bacterium]